MKKKSLEYNKLNEKYLDNANAVCTINGLLMAQAMCSRMLLETYSSEIIELMKRISIAIDNIKRTHDEPHN